MPRPGGPPSQRRPGQQPPYAPPSQYPPYGQQPYGQQPYQQQPYPQQHYQPPQHGHQHAPQHQPFTPQEANALLVDLAGAAAAATLMLVLTCWLLSLGGAFAAGHVETHAPAAKAAAAQH